MPCSASIRWVHDQLYAHTLEIRQVAGSPKNVELVFITRITIAAEQPLTADYVDGKKRVCIAKGNQVDPAGVQKVFQLDCHLRFLPC